MQPAPRPPRPASPRRTHRSIARALGAAAALALTSLAGEAAAQGIVFRLPGLGNTSYTFTSTTLATVRTSNFDSNPYDDGFLGLTERFDSAFSAAPWRLQIRFDGFLPFQSVGGSPIELGLRSPCDIHGICQAYLRPDFRLERLALRYQRNGITAEAGDFYAVVGRGLALSLRKVDPLGLDTTLRGAHFSADVDRVTMRVYAGYANPQNLDPITFAVNHDWGREVARITDTEDAATRPFPDVIAGAELVGRLGPDEDVEIAGNYQRLWAPQSNLRSFVVDVLGYRASAPALLDGALALHGELHVLRRIETARDAINMDRITRENATYGRAVYASAQYVRGRWTAVLEWKDYTNFLVSPDGGAVDPRRIYSGAPSLEREDVQFRTNANTRGGRLRLEHSFRPSPWTLAFNSVLNGFTEENDQDPWSANGFGAAHGYLTLRRRSRMPPPAATGSRPGDAPAPASGGDSSGAAVNSAATGGIGGGGRVAAGDWLLTASAGYRHEFTLGPRSITCGGVRCREGGAPDWQILHGDVDVTFSLGVNHSMEIRVDGRYERRWTDFLATGEVMGPGYYGFFRGGIAATYSYKDRLQISGVVRADTTAAARGAVITSPSGVTEPFPVLYPAAEIRYMFIPGSTLRLFGGMTPGGRLCTGGVCRDVPPFQGALLECVLRI